MSGRSIAVSNPLLLLLPVVLVCASWAALSVGPLHPVLFLVSKLHLGHWDSACRIPSGNCSVQPAWFHSFCATPSSPPAFSSPSSDQDVMSVTYSPSWSATAAAWTSGTPPPSMLMGLLLVACFSSTSGSRSGYINNINIDESAKEQALTHNQPL